MFIRVMYSYVFCGKVFLGTMKFLLSVSIIFAVACYLPVSSREEIKCRGDKEKPWSYGGENGPDRWGETYPSCYGSDQSPVDISDVEADSNLKSLQMINYDVDVLQANVLNNGHTVTVTPVDKIDRRIVVDGVTFNLTQMHFHWGSNYHIGSEHTFKSRAYALEAHFVHNNAVGDKAVVGALYQDILIDNPYWRPLIEVLPKVRFENDQTNLISPINLSQLLPEIPLPIYRYIGSLTTPDCADGVVWSLSKKIGSIGREQLQKFMKLYSVTRESASAGCRLNDNFRPVQALNGRKVYSST